MITQIINLTPHAIQIIGGPLFPPTGQIARVASSIEFVMEIGDSMDPGPVQVFRPTFGATVDLPVPIEGVALIVSALVRAANPTRTDLFSPGELVRDEKGNVIGCKNLHCN